MPLAITTSGARCLGTPRKRSNGSSVPSSSTATLRAGIERADAAAGDEGDAALGERRLERRGGLGRRRHGRRSGITNEISQASRTPRAVSASSSSSAHSLGAGGHLNGAPQTPIDRAALRERRDDLGQPLGAGHGVELVAALGEARRGVEVVVGAERDDEHVGLVDSRVGGHPPRLGIDRGDRLLQEPHAGLGDVAVGQPHRLGRRAPEHHVELREAEDERVALVDQRHLDVVAERLREHRAQLQPAEARAENEDARVHRATLSAIARAHGGA